MLLALAMMLTLQAGSDTEVDPADWDCATPYIERNYKRPVNAQTLAERIADECARPYKRRPINSPADETMEGFENRTYRANRHIFLMDISEKISARRRKDAVPLL